MKIKIWNESIFYHGLAWQYFCLTACDQDEQIRNFQARTTFIFGHFYGECMGGANAWKFFRLEQDKLFEDTKDDIQKSNIFYSGNFVSFRNKKFNNTKKFKRLLSNSLL